MYFSVYIIPMLALLLDWTDAAPQVPGTVSSTTTTVDNTVLTGDKMGAAAYTNDYSSTLVVYQAEDTSIRSLSGGGPPLTASSYASELIIAANIARNDTPLALIVQRGLYPTVHLFYLSDTACSGGNYIYQKTQDSIGPFQGTWRDGTLNSQYICSSSESNLLFTLESRTSGPQSTTAGPIRVGYMAANTGLLSEVWKDDSSTTWKTAAY